jgi:hypothetical protein
MEDFEGVTCLCRRGLTQGTMDRCGSIPARIARDFRRACGRVERASTHPRRARKLVRRAIALFARAQARTSTIVGQGALQVACGDSLGTILDDSRQRTERLAARL